MSNMEFYASLYSTKRDFKKAFSPQKGDVTELLWMHTDVKADILSADRELTDHLSNKRQDWSDSLCLSRDMSGIYTCSHIHRYVSIEFYLWRDM